MPEGLQLVEPSRARSRSLFFCVSSASMFLLIAIASCTSSQVFDEIYTFVSEFLSLSRSALSMSLRSSPNFGHFLCYAILSFSLSGLFAPRNVLLAPLLAGTYGLIMEALQIVIPSRSASWMDIVYNVIGIAIGFCCYLVWKGYVRE